jgi:hypothetical protein
MSPDRVFHPGGIEIPLTFSRLPAAAHLPPGTMLFALVSTAVMPPLARGDRPAAPPARQLLRLVSISRERVRLI